MQRHFQLTAWVVLEEFLQHLDMTGHLLSLSPQPLVRLHARGEVLAVGNPEILRDEHVAAVLLPANRVLSPSHLGN